RGDGLPGGDRRGLGGSALGGEPQELGDQGRVGAAVQPLVVVGGDGHGEVGVGAIAGAAAVPDADDGRVALDAAAEVLQPAGVADHHEVAPVVGGVVALLVAGEHAVVEPGQHHAEVLDVDDRVEVAQVGRRPDAGIEPFVGALPGGFGAAVGVV